MKKHLKIGELAKRTGVSVQTIRYYEAEGLIQPSYKTAKGYRYFDGDIIQIIENIKYYKSFGFTIKEIRVLLTYEKQPKIHCEDVQKIFKDKIQSIQENIDDLSAQKDILVNKLSACKHCDEKADCDEKTDCRILKEKITFRKK